MGKKKRKTIKLVKVCCCGALEACDDADWWCVYAIATQRRATLADDEKDSVVILRNLGDTVDRLDDQNARPIY